MHGRLLPRRLGHAACRYRAERRFARRGARRYPPGLESLGRSPERGFAAGSDTNGAGLDARVDVGVSADAADVGRTPRFIARRRADPEAPSESVERNPLDRRPPWRAP